MIVRESPGGSVMAVLFYRHHPRNGLFFKSVKSGGLIHKVIRDEVIAARIEQYVVASPSEVLAAISAIETHRTEGDPLLIIVQPERELFQAAVIVKEHEPCPSYVHGQSTKQRLDH